MGKYRKFTQEYRDEAVKLVIETSRPIAEVARELGINEGTLGNWMTKYRADHPVTEELSLPDRAKLRELERENRELRLQNEFLKKVVMAPRGAPPGGMRIGGVAAGRGAAGCCGAARARRRCRLVPRARKKV